MHYSVPPCLSFGALGFAALPEWVGAQDFEGAEKFSLIVRYDVRLNGGDVALGALVGGDLMLTGNVEFGHRLAAGDVGLHVGGSLAAGGHRVAMFGTHAFVGGGTVGVKLQQLGAALAADPLPLSIENIFAALAGEAAAFSVLTGDVGVAQATYAISGNRMNVALKAGRLNVLNLSAASARALLGDPDGVLVVCNLAVPGTRLVINTAGRGVFDFRAKTTGIMAAQAARVVWNFDGFTALNFGGSVETFRGTILAPSSAVRWAGGEIDGQVFAGSFVATQTCEFRNVVFRIDRPLMPEPNAYGLSPSGALEEMYQRWALGAA